MYLGPYQDELIKKAEAEREESLKRKMIQEQKYVISKKQLRLQEIKYETKVINRDTTELIEKMKNMDDNRLRLEFFEGMIIILIISY